MPIFKKMIARQAIGRQPRSVPLHRLTAVANFPKMAHGYLKHHEHRLAGAAARLRLESSRSRAVRQHQRARAQAYPCTLDATSGSLTIGSEYGLGVPFVSTIER